MSLDAVRNILTTRLDQGDRGDRGWFVITRFHASLSLLKGIANYIEARSFQASVSLSDQDYQRLGTIIETNSDDPGVQLRRHHLLAMDKPLQLLRRTNEPRWQEIELTPHGYSLALSNDPARVFEAVLSDIRFAAEPWFSAHRAARYDEFDVEVYRAVKFVLRRCEGYIDRDEFDFFVSRIRDMEEVNWAVDAITQYRTLRSDEQAELHSEVKNRIPEQKDYNNWRDVGLHTFSLFSLGTSMIRDATYLRLMENWAEAYTEYASHAEIAGASELRMPEPAESQALLTPPSAPASNDGAGAESFVAKVLRSQGWTVAFYTNRRGFGFDLWARKGDAAILIEVKSSVGQLGAISLTENEYRAAREHGENFVLALVEQLAKDNPRLRFIANPADTLEMIEHTTMAYTISRTEWLRATTD